MPINWKSPENTDRLLACLFASLQEGGAKINHARIAQLFGQDVSANAIQCQFKNITAAAKRVREEFEADGGKAGTSFANATPAKKGKSAKTPKKDALNGVKTGRVGKPATPAKKKNASATEISATPEAQVKLEELPTPPAELFFANDTTLIGTHGESQFGLGFGEAYDDYS